MGLDYSQGAVNFRDLGLWLNEIEQRAVLPEGRIFRGGKLDFVASLAELEHPASVLNLRRGIDPELGVPCTHLCVTAGTDTNQTQQPPVRRWLNQVMQFFADPVTRYPVYMHCTSGKDRTGIVAGVLGLVVGASLSTLETEYALSDGRLQPDDFRAGLMHIQAVGLQRYLDRVDLDLLRQRLREGGDQP